MALGHLSSTVSCFEFDTEEGRELCEVVEWATAWMLAFNGWCKAMVGLIGLIAVLWLNMSLIVLRGVCV